MAEMSGVHKSEKKIKKETSKSFLSYEATPPSEVRLSLISDARLQKITSSSLSSCYISDIESSNNTEYENYDLEYSTYLLRSLQKSLLKKNKEEKEESVKKCLVSLKLKWESLLEEHVRLSKDMLYFKLFFDVFKQSNCRIKLGKKILEILRENKFEIFFKTWSQCLQNSTNKLQLVDISKESIEEAFAKNILGTGSEIDICLKSIEENTKNNKEQISRISSELLDIKKLCFENSVLRERCCCLFKENLTKILESNYKLFTGVVKNLFKKRQESGADDLDDNDELCEVQKIFQPKGKLVTSQQSLKVSKLESPGL